MAGLAIAGALLLPQSVAAATVGVVYPDIRDPYRQVFSQILAGIRGRAGDGVTAMAVDSEEKIPTVRRWVAREEVEVVIALGRRGLAYARALDGKVPVVVGAVLLPPENGRLAGISLAPDPASLFSELRRLSPETGDAYVVYNPQQTGAIVKAAQRAADALGIELHTFAARDRRAAMQHYRRILSGLAEPTDAVWLPQDTVTVNDGVVLPLILERAWEKHLLVLSGNPAHVRRGVLLSLYPDNEAMGGSLASLALSRVGGSDGEPEKIRLLQDLKVAINIRTADHLGLNLSREELERFDLVFPAR